MEVIEKKYLFNEEMEQLLEDYALAHYMKEEGDDGVLDLKAARSYYQSLKKAN